MAENLRSILLPASGYYVVKTVHAIKKYKKRNKDSQNLHNILCYGIVYTTRGEQKLPRHQADSPPNTFLCLAPCPVFWAGRFCVNRILHIGKDKE